MVGAPERPPSRSSTEVAAQMPPKLGINAQRSALRSARGPLPTMRSLSPALQVMQRSMFAPTPVSPRVPDAPRGEQPREYIAALAGAAAYLEFQPPASPRRTASPEVLPPSPTPGRRPLSAGRRPLSARNRPPSSSAGIHCTGSTSLPTLGEDVCSGQTRCRPSKRASRERRKRPNTPDAENAPCQEVPRKAPGSARVRRKKSLDLAVDARPAPQSARMNRQQVSSNGSMCNRDESQDEKEDASVAEERILDFMRKNRSVRGDKWCTVEEAPREARTLGSTLRRGAKGAFDLKAAKPQAAPTDGDEDMDALDGLLASLDAERASKSEQQKTLSTPAVTPRKAKSDSQSIKCGIAPAQNTTVFAGKLFAGIHYDDEVVFSSPCDSLGVDESQTSASVYCPLSPTIMSVHLPGSPIPLKAVELDDTVSSVVMISGPSRFERHGPRPCRVRFECRGASEAEKYAPQVPCRKPFGTGKLCARPLGCTLVANFGGA